MRYDYSVVRFVPDGFRGEFVNLGIIVGSDETREWLVRWAQNPRHARRLAGDSPKLDAAYAYLHHIDATFEEYAEAQDRLSLDEPEIDTAWLRYEQERLRNLVQLTPPTPVAAESADAAVSMLFDQYVVDVERRTRRTRQAAVNAMRLAFHQLDLPDGALHERDVQGIAGRQRIKIDFALTGERLVQLAQGWSFAGQDPRAAVEQIKAWSWTMRDVRDGRGLLEIGKPSHPQTYEVPADVPIDVVYVPPETAEGERSLAEAMDVFEALSVSSHDMLHVGEVGTRARELLSV